MVSFRRRPPRDWTRVWTPQQNGARVARRRRSRVSHRPELCPHGRSHGANLDRGLAMNHGVSLDLLPQLGHDESRVPQPRPWGQPWQPHWQDPPHPFRRDESQEQMFVRRLQLPLLQEHLVHRAGSRGRDLSLCCHELNLGVQLHPGWGRALLN